MANSPAVSSRSLLCADSAQQPLPDNDADVIKALQDYGVLFKKTKVQAPERLDLLAGLMWVHDHKEDLHVVCGLRGAASPLGRGSAPNLRRIIQDRALALHCGASRPGQRPAGRHPREALCPKRRRGGPDSGAGRSPDHLGPRLFEALQD